MDELFDLYRKKDAKGVSHFEKSIVSKLNVKNHVDSSVYDDTWLSKMEETIRYLDNILRTPNRFIINEEEIVKVELARRITVDSIKHLSKNTNLIQDIDKKTGDVKPSKILNINKEESVNTYENRFIYTLINNMKIYIERKKKENLDGNYFNEDNALNYFGKSKVGKSKISINVQVKKVIDDKNRDETNIKERIEVVEQKIQDLCSTDVYRTLSKLHVAAVVSPIKKTNLILKNTNFQYAVDLWNYLQTHMDESSKKEVKNKDFDDNGELKALMNQSFLLNYLIIEKLSELNSLDEMDNVIEENGELPPNTEIKYKNRDVTSTEDIERRYKEAISGYINQLHDIGVKKDEKNNETDFGE